MEIKVTLDGGKKVTAHFDGFSVVSDQPIEDGGQGLGPAPFDFFLASLATCAGYFVQSFCQTRKIPTDGISLTQKSEWDEATHLVKNILLTVQLPADFPERYKSSVVAAIQQCTVKKHLQNPPTLDIVVK